MKKIIVVLSMLLVTVFAAPAIGQTEHCPDKDNPNKVEVSEDFGPTVTIPEGHEFCVKAGNQASGVLVSDGEPYTVTWKNNGGQTPGISYYIDYDKQVEPSPEPSPSVTPEPEPTVTPTPSESPEPETPTPEPTPTDSSSPSMTPEPQEPGGGVETPSGPVVVDEPDTTETVEELPNTGPEDVGLIALLGLCLLGAGSWITRKYGWMN